MKKRSRDTLYTPQPSGRFSNALLSYMVAAMGLVTFLVVALTWPTEQVPSALYEKPQSQAATPRPGFVYRQGTKFYLDGKEFKFVGFNLFDAANSYFPEQNKQGYSCPRDNNWWSNIFTEADLDREMQYMKQHAGATVLRFWAYQRFTNNATDWSGIDKVIRVAKKNGFKVIPVLEDGPGFCTYPEPQGFSKWEYNNDTWYTEGYKLRMGNYRLTYPEYVKEIVTRYKDEPTIMAWMMVNEADTSRKTDGVNGSGQSVLVAFAKHIGGIIKAADPDHLLTVGTQSNGASGASGRDFVPVYGLPEIDFTEIHYWGSGQDPMPGSPDGKTLPDTSTPECQKAWGAKLACSIAFSLKQLNKPIIVGEAGVAARTDAERVARANLMDKQMESFFGVGGAGYLVWQWNKIIDNEGYDVLMVHNDPLLPKMKARLQAALPSVTPVNPSLTPTPTVRPTMTPTTTPGVSGDINNDGKVNVFDLGLLIGKWGSTDAACDLNKDGTVSVFDLGILAAKWTG